MAHARNAEGWVRHLGPLRVARGAGNSRVTRVVPLMRDGQMSWWRGSFEGIPCEIMSVRWSIMIGRWGIDLLRRRDQADEYEDVRVAVKLGRRFEEADG